LRKQVVIEEPLIPIEEIEISAGRKKEKKPLTETRKVPEKKSAKDKKGKKGPSATQIELEF
jgi:hypothetical protein